MSRPAKGGAKPEEAHYSHPVWWHRSEQREYQHVASPFQLLRRTLVAALLKCLDARHAATLA
jgi:hypothetical protein